MILYGFNELTVYHSSSQFFAVLPFYTSYPYTCSILSAHFYGSIYRIICLSGAQVSCGHNYTVHILLKTNCNQKVTKLQTSLGIACSQYADYSAVKASGLHDNEQQKVCKIVQVLVITSKPSIILKNSPQNKFASDHCSVENVFTQLL